MRPLARGIIEPLHGGSDAANGIGVREGKPGRAPGGDGSVSSFPVVVGGDHLPGVRRDELVGTLGDRFPVESQDASALLTGADLVVTSAAGVPFLEVLELDGELEVFFSSSVRLLNFQHSIATGTSRPL